jgi:iron(III) transport system substrate-binding protein
MLHRLSPESGDTRLEWGISKHRLLGVLSLLCMLMLLVGGCGGDDDSASEADTGGAASAEPGASLEETAKKEGSVMFYTLSEDVATAMREGFTKEYPWAKVEAVIGAPGEIASRVVTETRAEANKVDVIMLPGGQRAGLMQANAVQPVELPSEEKIPDALKDADNLAHPVYVTPIVLPYNTNALEEGDIPKDVFELSDPSWKGRIAFDRPQNRALSATFLAAWREGWGDEKWKSWLEGLKNNEILLTTDASAAYQAALRGEVELGVSVANDVLAQRKGTPMANGFYDQVVPFLQYIWLAKSAPHPATAELFMDWMVSEKGQLALAETGLSPALEGLETKNALENIMPAGAELMPASNLTDFYENPEEYSEIFDEYWPG